MLRISVMLFALLAVGCGYIVFAHVHNGLIWDIALLAFALAFIVSFVYLIWQHVVASMSDQENPHN